MSAWIGFGVAIGSILYVLFGYPVLLGVLARRFAKPVERAPYEPRVSIIIAVQNGERFLANKLSSILALQYPHEKMEIIVASDGSTDRTDAIARSFAGSGVRLLALDRGGKPSALNAGIAAAGGEILVLTDVRQALAPDSLRLLMENFADAKVGAASGELVLLKPDGQGEANVGLYWKYEIRIRLDLSALDSIFGATGAYYALRRELSVPIPPSALLDDMYLPLAAFFRGYRLVVDPRVHMFDSPMSIETEFRRKVRTLAGNYQILGWYPKLLGPGNRMWLHFVSYKFARLLLPFALVAVLLCSFHLPGFWSYLAVGGQIIFYSAAVLDFWIPDRSLLKRISSPIRTFVSLMAAAFLAPSIIFIPGTKFWRPTELRHPPIR